MTVLENHPRSLDTGQAARLVSACLAGLAMLLGEPADGRAQDEPATEAARQTVVAGEQYERPPGGSKWLLGRGYRDLWTAPIEVEVLDLQVFAGGLTPVMRVGGMQTLGLALRGADGLSYTFRAVHKDLVRVLPEELRDTAVGDIAQDMLAASVPGSGLAAVPIAVAAGVRQRQPRLFVMPDSKPA